MKQKEEYFYFETELIIVCNCGQVEKTPHIETLKRSFKAINNLVEK
jgi:hypothetical protein